MRTMGQGQNEDGELPQGQAGRHHSATSDDPPPGPDRDPDDKDPPLTTSGALFPFPRAPAHPRHGSPASQSCSPGRRHGSGEQDTAGAGGGQLQVSSWKNAVSDPRGKASGTLRRRTRLVWVLRSSVKGNFGILGDCCFYNAF